MSSHRGDEFVRIAQNVSSIVTDISLEGVMIVNSFNINESIHLLESHHEEHHHGHEHEHGDHDHQHM